MILLNVLPSWSIAFILLTAISSTQAFSCNSIEASSIKYDISPLSGLRKTGKDTSTPPTTSEARVTMDLCGDGLDVDGGIPSEDQCPAGTKVCLRVINRKDGQDERIISVIPIWTKDLPDSDIWTTPMGSKGEEGLKIWVEGPDYAGTKQTLNFTLLCSSNAHDPEPTFVSYTPGRLSLEWSTPDACPRDGNGDGGGGYDGDNGGNSGGVGFFGFLKFLFWLSVVGLIAYFAIGIFYNHQQYSARGWDLVPHKDFWREFPTLVQDLFAHVFANVRGGGAASRGGYSSLG